MTATASQTPPVTFGQVLKNKPFLALWAARTVSNFGDWLAVLGLFSLVAFRWQGTPYQVSGLLIAFAIPLALFGPIAGVCVDRWDVKRTLIMSDLIRAVLAVLLGMATALPQLYLLIFALSAVSCFFLPAQMVALPQLVRREELLVANALTTQTMNLNRVISPAVAGALVAWAGEQLCFYLDSLSFLGSAALLARLALPRRAVAPSVAKPAMLKELRTGLGFIVGQRALTVLISSMVAAIWAMGVFDTLLAVYVRDMLMAQTGVFSAMMSLIGGATLVGSYALGRVGQRQSKLRLVVVGILIIGLSVLVLAACGRVWVTLACCLGLGLGLACVLVLSQTLIQEETPAEMLGRVGSTATALMTVAQLLAFLLAGTIAAWMGISNLYSLVALVLVLIAWWAARQCRATRQVVE
jgi:MFS family permease